MGMRIIDINGGNTVEVHDNNFKTTGLLFFDTKEEANSYTNLNKWGAGTMCYTAAFETAVLKTDGTWSWKGE